MMRRDWRVEATVSVAFRCAGPGEAGAEVDPDAPGSLGFLQ